MLAEEIAALTRLYIDEDDQTFVSDANLTTALTAAYSRFRQQVGRTDQSFYEVRVEIAPAADNYNLATGAVAILGAAPTTTAMIRLIRIADVDTSGNVNWWLRAAGSAEEVTAHARMWRLEGSTLRFSDTQAGRTLRLHYVPVSAVDWTQIDPADNEFVDDLDEFHTLIALYAAQEYAVRDGLQNPALDALRAQRELELEMYLAQGRVPESQDHVIRGVRGPVGGVW